MNAPARPPTMPTEMSSTPVGRVAFPACPRRHFSCDPGARTLVFGVEPSAEEVEEDLEHREDGHGEDHTQKSGYLSPRDDSQEDQYRGHVEHGPLYRGLQDVALELLNYQVEEGGQERRGGRDGEGHDHRGYGTEPCTEVRDYGRERDPGSEQQRVGNTEQEETQRRDRTLYGHIQGQPAQVAREREGEGVPELAGVPPVALGSHSEVCHLELANVRQQVDGDEEHPEE